MPYRYQMTFQNEHGDNGWWKKTGDDIAHYFNQRFPLCGTYKFSNPDMGVQRKTAYDRRCKNCSKVRRNHLRARMNEIPINEAVAKSGAYQKPFDPPWRR